MINNRKGFTLVELLVVMSIIAILAAAVLVSLGGFRARARDSNRVSDLKQTQNALELYYGVEGRYPAAADWGALVTELTGAGIGVKKMGEETLDLPYDPYEYGTDGQSYVLKAYLENKGTILDNSYYDSTGVGGVTCDQAAEPFEYCLIF